MKITIIGCGYVGRELAKLWQRAGHYLTVTTTNPEKVAGLADIAQRVLVVKGNDLEAITEAIKNQEVVVLSVAPRKGHLYEETYLKTAQTLVKALKQFPTIKQIIYTATYSVYGDQKGEWVDEETELLLTTEKSQILAATEQELLTAAGEDLAVCILRLGGIYGPGREIEKIFRAAFGNTRPGTGKEITNWIHLDDIVAAIDFAQQHRLTGIYNLVNDAYLSSRDLLDGLAERHNLPPVNWDETQQSLRPYNVRVSNDKIKQAGYQFIHPQIFG